MGVEQQQRSYAQYGQDRYVVDRLLKGMRNGKFLEIGAFDGLTLSNTALLELDYDWSGICIEALPDRYAALAANRACVCIHAAATEASGQKIAFQVVSGESAMLSGRPDAYVGAHKRRIAGEQARLGTSSSLIDVSTVRAADELRSHGMTSVDFASIDIEGGELSCLKGLLDDDIRVGIICVENNYGGGAVHQLLRRRGYLRIARLGSDDVYRLATECDQSQVSDARMYVVRNWRSIVQNARRRWRW